MFFVWPLVCSASVVLDSCGDVRAFYQQSANCCGATDDATLPEPRGYPYSYRCSCASQQTFDPYVPGTPRAGRFSPTLNDVYLANVNSTTLKTLKVRLGSFGRDYWKEKHPERYAAAGSPDTHRVWSWEDLMAAGAPVNYNYPFALQDDSWLGGLGRLVEVVEDQLPDGFDYGNYAKFEYLFGRWAPGATRPARTDGVTPMQTISVMSDPSQYYVAGFTHKSGPPGSSEDPYSLVRTTSTGFIVDASQNGNFAGIHRDGHLAGMMYNQSLGDFEAMFDVTANSLMNFYDDKLVLNSGWPHPTAGMILRSKHAGNDRRHFMGDGGMLRFGGALQGATLGSEYKVLSVRSMVSGGSGYAIGDVLSYESATADGTMWVSHGSSPPAGGTDVTNTATNLGDAIRDRDMVDGVVNFAVRELSVARNDGKVLENVTMSNNVYILVDNTYYVPKIGDPMSIRVDSVNASGAITSFIALDVGSLYKSAPTTLTGGGGQGASFAISEQSIGPMRYPSPATQTSLGELYKEPGTYAMNVTVGYKVRISKHPTRPGYNLRLWMKKTTGAEAYIRVKWNDPLNKNVETDTLAIISSESFEAGQVSNAGFEFKNFIGKDGGFFGFVVGSGLNYEVSNWMVGPISSTEP